MSRVESRMKPNESTSPRRTRNSHWRSCSTSWSFQKSVRKEAGAIIARSLSARVEGTGDLGALERLLSMFSPAVLIFRNWDRIRAFFSELWLSVRPVFTAAIALTHTGFNVTNTPQFGQPNGLSWVGQTLDYAPPEESRLGSEALRRIREHPLRIVIFPPAEQRAQEILAVAKVVIKRPAGNVQPARQAFGRNASVPFVIEGLEPSRDPVVASQFSHMPAPYRLCMVRSGLIRCEH